MRFALAASLWTLTVASACRDREPPTPLPLVIWDVQVQVVAPAKGEVPCPARVATVLALLGGPWHFEPGETSRLDVVVGCEREGGCVSVHAAVGLVVTSPSEPEALFEGSAIQTAGCLPTPLSAPFLVAATARAVREALVLAYDQYHILRAGDLEVLRVIEQGRPRGALLQALVVAGDRRMREAVPLLLRYLDLDDPDVIMRAVGALGRIRAPEALRPLGRLALAPVPEVPHAALQAIADIGGDEARRVLEFVAEQSQSPVVVREARGLLDGLGPKDHLRGQGSGGKGE